MNRDGVTQTHGRRIVYLHDAAALFRRIHVGRGAGGLPPHERSNQYAAEFPHNTSLDVRHPLAFAEIKNGVRISRKPFHGVVNEARHRLAKSGLQ
jgi:hypothetical protein